MSHLPVILVVEDDPDVREYAVQVCTDLGATVFEAADATRALELLLQHPEISVLFSDIQMPPGMSGIELAGEAWKLNPRLHLVLTSGALGTSPLKDVTFLRKPYHTADLVYAVMAVSGQAKNTAAP